MKAKNKLVIRSIEVKKKRKKCDVLIFKKDICVKKKTLLQWILRNVLEDQALQGTAKFTEMKGIEKSNMQRIREIGEKFLSTLLLIFISSCYFI